MNKKKLEDLRRKIVKWLISLTKDTTTTELPSSITTSQATIINMMHNNNIDYETDYYKNDGINNGLFINNNNIINHNNNRHIDDDNDYYDGKNYFFYERSSNGGNIFQRNATTYLASRNISISDLNITSANLNDFIHKLLQLSGQLNDSKFFHDNYLNECNLYCEGSIRDVFLGYKDIHGYISLLICIFGTIANILNIIVLTRKDMSKTPINKILKWLAVTDMFVMIEYIPFTTYMYILSPDEHYFTYYWASYLLFHMHFTQILHTISICLTVTLAVWRFIAIKHAHGKFSTYLLSHCNEAILLSFIIAPILCFPTYFVFRVKHVYSSYSEKEKYVVDAEEDTMLYGVNFWVHSVMIKLLPCLILTVISFILVRVLCDASKRRMKLKESSNLGVSSLNGKRTSKCDRRPDRTTMLLVAVLILFLITEFPQGILGLMSGILQKCFLVRCYTLFGELMDLLALINAAVGFVLYGLMSKQFRTSFKSLFLSARLSGNEMTRITGMTTTCV